MEIVVSSNDWLSIPYLHQLRGVTSRFPVIFFGAGLECAELLRWPAVGERPKCPVVGNSCSFRAVVGQPAPRGGHFRLPLSSPWDTGSIDKPGARRLRDIVLPAGRPAAARSSREPLAGRPAVGAAACNRRSLARSQNRISASLPEARTRVRPSGENSTVFRQIALPSKLTRRWPVATVQSQTTPSLPAVARRAPSGEKAIELIDRACAPNTRISLAVSRSQRRA